MHLLFKNFVVVIPKERLMHRAPPILVMATTIIKYYTEQRRANPNPDLDLNPDLTTFPNPAGFGFGFDFKIFKSVDLDLDLDLSFFKVLDLDLDLKIAGFGFEFFKSTNPATKFQVDTNFSTGTGWTVNFRFWSMKP